LHNLSNEVLHTMFKESSLLVSRFDLLISENAIHFLVENMFYIHNYTAMNLISSQNCYGISWYKMHVVKTMVGGSGKPGWLEIKWYT